MHTSNIIGYLFAFACGFLLSQYLGSSERIERHFTDVQVVKGDSFPYVVYSGIPVPYEVVKIDSFWKDRDIDTTAILYDYFANYSYLDTLKDDTSALIILSENISENKILNRHLTFQNRRNTAVIINRNKALLVGVGLNKLGPEIGIGYRLNRDIITASYQSNNFGIRYFREF